MLESLTQLVSKTVSESIFLVDFHIFLGLRFHGLRHWMKSCQTRTYDRCYLHVELTNVYPGYQRNKRLNNDLIEVKNFRLSFPSQPESTLMTKSCRWHLVSEMMLNLHTDHLGLPAVFLCLVWWYRFTRCIPVFCLVEPLKKLHTSVDVRKTHTCFTSPKPKTGRIRGFWLLIMFLSSIESWLPGPGKAFN